MDTAPPAWPARHPLRTYVALAFGLSWLIEIPLAVQAHGIIDFHLTFGLHYLSGYGPMLAALVVTIGTGGTSAAAELLRRVGRWRVGIGWWLVAISPLLLLIAVSIVSAISGYRVPGIDAMGLVDHFPALGITAPVFWIATFGLGEETGWRGFALPQLQRRHSALTATLILWVAWAAWHTPLFFYMYPLSVLPGLVIGLLAGAIVFTWIFNSTGGSVLMTAIWHGLFNYATACSVCKASTPTAVLSTLVMVTAVLIVLVFKSATLSRLETRFTGARKGASP